jgi:hypothetical protein
MCFNVLDTDDTTVGIVLYISNSLLLLYTQLPAATKHNAPSKTFSTQSTGPLKWSQKQSDSSLLVALMASYELHE